jgi:hypothetical protein
MSSIVSLALLSLAKPASPSCATHLLECALNHLMANLQPPTYFKKKLQLRSIGGTSEGQIFKACSS